MAFSFRGKGFVIAAAISLVAGLVVWGSWGLKPSVLGSVAFVMGLIEPPSPEHSANAEQGPAAAKSVKDSTNVRSPKGTPDFLSSTDSTTVVGQKVDILTAICLRPFGELPTAERIAKKRRRALDKGPVMIFENTAPIAASFSNPTMARQGETQDGRRTRKLAPFTGPIKPRPEEGRARKSRKSFDGDLRNLVSKPKKDRLRFVHEKVLPNPQAVAPKEGRARTSEETQLSSIAPGMTALAPAPINTFEGLGRTGGWGNGYPADPTGDVGPEHYVQAINTALAVYDKSGNILAGPMNLDTFMSQGNFGNLCDTDNFGDPVVLYDTFEDRWIVSNFAFTMSGQTVVNPPGSFQCIAVSKTGDPVAGGWNYYSINRTDALNDYPKLAVWHDGVYMSANMFDFSAGGFYHGVRVWAINKVQMYAGSPDVQIVSFDIGTGDFSLLPSNARLQTGTPPPGTPNFFVSTWNFLNALSVYKFNVNWNKISLSTFTGPDIPLAATSLPNNELSNASVPSGGATLDPVPIRAMMQNTYINIGGAESLWVPHTVRRANTSGAAAPRWYQVNITGGNVFPNIPQASTWDPDGTNAIHRYMPSLSVDRAGNMALGYTASGTLLHPSIRYAGRLFSDPVNTFSLTEQTMFAGTGSQIGTGRWGDYTHMTLDPDGCTFWYTNQYYTDTGSTYRSRVGSFKFDQCTIVGRGTLTGTVTSNGVPVPDASVSLGARTSTTDVNGVYSFHDLPAGTYPKSNAMKAGFSKEALNSVVVNEGAITTQNFSLEVAPDNDCLPDSSQSHFQNGVPENVELTSAGEVVLSAASTVDQQNLDLVVESGAPFTTAWHAQTFTPGETGPVKRVDVHLFSVDCNEVTMPALTVSIRAASGDLPNGPDLAAATTPGFCNGTSRFISANFTVPANVTAGAKYAIVWRTTLTGPSTDSNPRYVSTISSSNPYPGGRRATSTNSGSSWTGAGNSSNDFGFRVFVDTGFSRTGSFTSGLKDANPAAGSVPKWGNIIWTNNVLPPGTGISFQAAASNSSSGAFAFVGPDGTASTFFVNGGSLAQFDGNRYLRYRAILSTTNGTNSPTLNDVNVCFDNQTAATCIGVSISDHSSTTGKPLSVPVNVGDMSGLGVRSADFTVTFDPNVILPAGTSANNWGVTLGSVGMSNGGARTLTVSRPTPGSLAVSLFGTSDLDGAGDLVNLNFSVVGNPAASTDVSFASFMFNEGDHCVSTTNGSVAVLLGSISGKVTYGNIGTPPYPNPVPNVTISAAGTLPLLVTTANDGTYSLSGTGTGQYTVTPLKSAERESALSGFDAAAIASHVVGGAQLTNNQVTVADVSGNGSVSSFDAALVATFVAGLPNEGSTGTWRFMPANRVYPNVNVDYADQDYVALLMGDVTGNWTAPSSPASLISSQLNEEPKGLDILAPELRASPGTSLTVPVTIGETTGLGIRSCEFELHFDGDVVEPATMAADIADTISQGRVLTVNALEKGVLRVVIFGAFPLEGRGDLINLHFNVIGAVDSVTEVRWENFRLNEGGIPFKTDNGLVSVAALAESGTINGRLLDPSGGGVRRARVTVTDSQGNSRLILTSTLGYFQISALKIGETYTVRADTRRYRFAPQSVSITSSNAIELEMIGLE